MPTRKEAIEFAKQFDWTGKDAERAYVDLDLKTADEQDLLMALVKFAGPELLDRQRLQGAQKAQVTKKKNYIKEIELEFESKVNEYEATLRQERSAFVGIIDRIYKIAKQFGFEDPWIEALIEKYDEYQEQDAA